MDEDEHRDVWHYAIVVLIVIGVALVLGAITLLVQPWLVSLSPPLIPTHIIPSPTP